MQQIDNEMVSVRGGGIGAAENITEILSCRLACNCFYFTILTELESFNINSKLYCITGYLYIYIYRYINIDIDIYRDIHRYIEFKKLTGCIYQRSLTKQSQSQGNTWV